MKLLRRLFGKRQARPLAGTGRWFTASLLEANSRAGRLAYGVAI